ncbi:MAG: hypothetical protein MUE85_14410 [Microscillaceae bacterium]|jgi:DNA-directed RNA polymerase specialized sigma subunit|nr:hypothetical protein [Microscillaceae bacterium]
MAKSTQPKTDQELFACIQNGDLTCLGTFYEENFQTLLRWGTKHYDKYSKDFLNEKIHHALSIMVNNIINGKLKALKCSLRTYWFGIYNHIILAEIKAQNRKLELKEAVFELSEPVIEYTISDAEWEQWLEAVAACLPKLDDNCLQILDAFYYQEKTIEEIAFTLKYDSKHEVSQRKWRCFSKLKRKVFKYLTLKPKK